MSRKFVQKNLKLSLEFDRYLGSHPGLFAKIPKGAHIVITVKGDEAFNKNSQAISSSVRSPRQKFTEARKEGEHWIIRSLVAA